MENKSFTLSAFGWHFSIFIEIHQWDFDIQKRKQLGSELKNESFPFGNTHRYCFAILIQTKLDLPWSWLLVPNSFLLYFSKEQPETLCLNSSSSFCNPRPLLSWCSSDHTARSCHSPMHMQGQLESLGSIWKGEEIGQYLKRQLDLINASKCSAFPDKNCFYSFRENKGKSSLPYSLCPNYITSAQKKNILGYLMSGSWTCRYFHAAESILLSSVPVFLFIHIISCCTVMG